MSKSKSKTGRPADEQTRDTPKWARRLRELRQAKGWTIRQLAEAAGLNEKTLARWDDGEREPQVLAALALAQALGVSVEEIFGVGE